MFLKAALRPAIQSRFAVLHTGVSPLRAGHSKWANIRHTKALKDGQRSAQFVKLARQIRVSIQEGGGANPASNTQLRQAIDEAHKRQMPNHTVQGILRKAQSQPEGAKLKRHVIELRVQHRASMVCVLYTDKFAGDRMQLATLFRKGGAQPQDVRHMFDEKGFVQAVVPAGIAGGDDLAERCMDDAIEGGAEDVQLLDADRRQVLFVCDPDELDRLKQKLQALGYDVESSEHVFIPHQQVQLAEAELKSYRQLRDKLLAFEGIEDIYDNVLHPDDDELMVGN